MEISDKQKWDCIIWNGLHWDFLFEFEFELELKLEWLVGVCVYFLICHLWWFATTH